VTCYFCGRKGTIQKVELKNPHGTRVLLWKGEICNEDAKKLGEIKK